MDNTTEKELTQEDVFAQGNYLVRYALDGGGKDVLDSIYHFPLLANLDDAEHKSAFYFLIKDSLARLKSLFEAGENKISLKIYYLLDKFLLHPQVTYILRPENLLINNDDTILYLEKHSAKLLKDK
ncbi:MAG: hypothetical protein U9Q38_06415 [Thermodesulfobacteriota bacterium]|nr:hypothetical protein [Thermodesulfobacteriota bacterium]